ncbi:sugar-binding transcriptional regulator [Arthrobacter halodurans]|uniref:Sugar-binding transcriptional regulator n=1 Tax=Arthrobacter halodurans TaxID=516699 RepID=A0ABV4UV53_9MICC
MSARYRDVLRAASMYYLQDMKMETIARHLQTSRSTVSRMIKEARDTGIVEISLRPEHTRAPGLGQRIRDAYGVEAFVVPVLDSDSQFDRLHQVARTTARLVGTWFGSEMVLAVAWGTTLGTVVPYLTSKETRGSVVVQLNGAANTRTSGVHYAGDLMMGIARNFGAQVHYFPVPAFFDYAETKDAMWRERSVRRVVELQRKADIALFSVGALRGELPSHVYSAGYLEADDIARLDAEGAVGDVCTVFLREDGSYGDIEINRRATGPTPAQLRRIPRRVCAVAGDNKVVPLIAALRAGTITHLILDELTAARLLDQ